MDRSLWDIAGEFSESFRGIPRVVAFLEAFNDSGGLSGEIAERVASYQSWLRISPMLMGTRINQMVVGERLLADADTAAWFNDAVKVGAAFQVVVEFLRSRLPGYPTLGVPHCQAGSAYLLDTDVNFFHHFPWDMELMEIGLQASGPPNMTKLGGTDPCSAVLEDLSAVLQERNTWQRFLEAEANLSASDRKELHERCQRFMQATDDDEVRDQVGTKLISQYEYRLAVLEECVSGASSSPLAYLRAFEAVDELISIVAALMQTIIVHAGIRSVVPTQLDIGGGGEVVSATLLARPDQPHLTPGEVILVDGPSEVQGLLWPDAIQHSWGRADHPASSTVQLEGRFIFL